MKYYFENIKTMEEVVNLDEKIFINEFKSVIEDSILTDEEISKLTMLLKREEYENPRATEISRHNSIVRFAGIHLDFGWLKVLLILIG